MLGVSLRNQGRYLWNCSTEGLTGPRVKPTQFFKQARESAKRAGLQAAAPGAWPPCSAPPATLCPAHPGTRPVRAAGSSPCAQEHLRFSLTVGSCLHHGNCQLLRTDEEGKSGAEKQPTAYGASPLQGPRAPWLSPYSCLVRASMSPECGHNSGETRCVSTRGSSWHPPIWARSPTRVF